MRGPVVAALAGQPDLAARYAAFRDAAHGALDAALVADVQQAVAAVHGRADPVDEAALDPATRACLAYARRIPYEHTAITDDEAAAVVAALGEPGYVALSVVAALADAECRVAMVDLPTLAGQA